MTVAASTTKWRFLAAILILLSGAWHVYYIAQPGALDLAPDEAHYWMWSRRLDISYYSKGPLVAWLIRGSCELFGPLSQRLCGSDALAVRLPAVWCGSAMLIGLYVLTARGFTCERLAFFVVAGALTLPMVALSRSVMTIDSPFMCCWCWACVFGHEAIIHRARWAWPVLGITLALGILAKYTMVLWVVSALLFLLSARAQRPQLRQWGPWLAAGLSGLACLPIIWWNIANDWVSFRHVSSLAGTVSTPAHTGVRWLGPLSYLGTQGAILLGFWFVIWLCALVAKRPWRESNPVNKYLWFLSAPTFAVFLVFSTRTDILPNWPVPAYVSGLVLAAHWLEKHIATGPMWKRVYLGGSCVLAGAAGMAVTMCSFHVQWIRPVLVQWAGAPTEAKPMPLRRFDPTCRLRGWRYLGTEVAALENELSAAGERPVVAGSRWYYASEISFYTNGRFDVLSLGPIVADRQSQFDLWRPNPIRDPAAFAGKTFIFVDVRLPQEEIEQAFSSVEPLRTISYQEDGEPIARWYLTVCRGFRGFGALTKKNY